MDQDEVTALLKDMHSIVTGPKTPWWAQWGPLAIILFAFVGAYFGWLPSPVLQSQRASQDALEVTQTAVLEVVRELQAHRANELLNAHRLKAICNNTASSDYERARCEDPPGYMPPPRPQHG